MIKSYRHWLRVFASWLVMFLIGCRSEVPTKSTTSQKENPPTATSAVVTPASDEPFQLESDFVPLTYDQFDAFGADADTWKSTEDGIACTGKPKGYLYSKQSYQGFTLRLEYRFPRPAKLTDDGKFKGNTGFLVCINGEHKLWPVCLEVQGKYVQMAAIKENGGAQPIMTDDDEAARQRARKPVGQWNAIEIISKGGKIQTLLNGVPISNGQLDFLSEGLIGIQAEDHPFEIRRMRIRSE